MRYPNLRYGNPTEFRAYVKGIPLKDLAKQLKRSERTVSDWLHEVKRVPYWVPEMLRLRHMETDLYMLRMGYKRLEEQARRRTTAANDSQYLPLLLSPKLRFCKSASYSPKTPGVFLTRKNKILES